jgi:phosphatidylinositol alpha-1,6-mannosyltransferase
LYLSYNFPPKLGGLEQVAYHSFRALSEIGDVTVLAQATDGYIDTDKNVLRATRVGLFNFFGFLFARGRQAVLREKFDLVVASSALLALPTFYLAKLGGAKSVIIIHGLDVVYPSLVYQMAMRFSLANVDLVLANSKATKNEAVTRGVLESQIEIIHPGCEWRQFQENEDRTNYKKEWGLDGGRVILSPGRLVARKGLDRFIEKCLPRIVKAIPDAKLLVAGGNPQEALAHRQDQQALVRQAARHVGLEDKLVITGKLNREQMSGAFQLSDLVILPLVPVEGDMEGFGIVCLEAGAAAKPVVAFDLGGVSDAIEDGVNGHLVPAGDYTKMADQVVGILQAPEEAERIGQAGRKRVEQNFGWDVIGKQYQEAILGLVN